MIFFLIVGIALGAIAVLFVLQNTAVVTVSFFAWSLQGSLALILFLAITTGVVIALLLVLPGLINEALTLRALRKQNKKLGEELAATNTKLAQAQSHPTPPVFPPDTT